MLIVWWILWLYPALATAPDLATCSKKWVRMTDQNYQRAIKHYADCVLLGQALDPPAREAFQSNIVINLQKTCDYFFQRTTLPTSGLIGVVREVAKILEGFEQEPQTSGIIHNNVSWSTAHSRCRPLATPEYDDMCPSQTRIPENNEGDTRPPADQGICPSRGPSRENSYSTSSIICMVLVFLLLLIFQVLFIIWVCCCNNCICVELCKSEGTCLCDTDDSYENVPVTEAYHMSEIQQDLASLSSENIGSDSEFEALLKMKKLPKTKRQWYSKEAD